MIGGIFLVRSEAPWASWLGWLTSFAIYSLFAAIFFVVHGTDPPLMIDHLAYMKQADDIIGAHPDGAYWRSLNETHSYGVAMAYLYGLTGSHIVSMKFLLSAMTILSLLAFELLMGLVSTAKWKSVLFALLSGFFVTFGASFWGYTDYAASVQRTAIMPIALVSVWFWLAQGDRPLKFIVFPALVGLSVVHLSAYYVAAVLGIVAFWDWAARRRFRLDFHLLWLITSLVAAQIVHFAIEQLGLAFTDNLMNLVVPISGGKLDHATAWQIELMAFPWRNMPLPLPTLLTIAASYGVIFLVAVAGLVHAARRGLTELDRAMITLAIATIVIAYGPQLLLWVARQLISIYPLSLEETRAVNLIMIPSLYFGYRFFDLLWNAQNLSWSRSLAAGVALLIVLQPLTVLRMIPESGKQRILDLALGAGLIRKSDSLRLLYARQVLGLPDEGAKFYYSARGVLRWLRENAGPNTRVISTLNELLLVDVDRVGPFNGLLNKAVAAPERKLWADSVADADQAIASGDLAEVDLVGRKYGATLAVVPWTAHGALYRDEYYSIVRIGQSSE